MYQNFNFSKNYFLPTSQISLLEFGLTPLQVEELVQFVTEAIRCEENLLDS